MSGPAGHAALQSHYSLGERPSLLPPHGRGLKLLLEADVRDLAGLQDGRSAHLLHRPRPRHHRHRQAAAEASCDQRQPRLRPADLAVTTADLAGHHS